MSSSKSGRRLPGSSRQPTFQPPSYYAAAAGVQYSSLGNSDFPGAASHSTMSNPHPSYPPVDRYPASAREDSRKNQDTPPSGRRSALLSKSILSGANGHREANDKPRHEKRQSRIVDIPFMETSLLPSLRDTIDKMTHPPTWTQAHDALTTRDSGDIGPMPGSSQGLSSYSVNTAAYQDVGRPLGLSPGHILTPAHTSRTPTNVSTLSGSSGLRTPQISTPKTAYSTPKVSFARTEVTSPAAPTGIPKTPRSALKGSRTPQTLSPNPPQISASPGTPGKSLRSIKSMIGSKQSIPAQLTPGVPPVCLLVRFFAVII